MSYNFKVEFKDGQPDEVQVVYGPVPDGIYTISGHEDDRNLSLGVMRQDEGASSTPVISISSSRPKHASKEV